jgi:hypothetical protein
MYVGVPTIHYKGSEIGVAAMGWACYSDRKDRCGFRLLGRKLPWRHSLAITSRRLHIEKVLGGWDFKDGNLIEVARNLC